MEKGMKVKLVKEPDNAYDKEAIQVMVKGLGKCGYVANSPYTVLGESMSVGRLYDRIVGLGIGNGQPPLDVVVLHPQLGESVGDFGRDAGIAAGDIA